MDNVDDVDAAELSRAVVVWTGYKSAAFPTRDDAALIGAFADKDAFRLIRIVKALEEDFYKSEAYATAANLQEMQKAASSEFKNRHPDLPDVIADAFAWCYSFDYK